MKNTLILIAFCALIIIGGYREGVWRECHAGYLRDAHKRDSIDKIKDSINWENKEYLNRLQGQYNDHLFKKHKTK